ncbi:MAG: methyltransferase domain-containing protein [Arenicellales bacterium]
MKHWDAAVYRRNTGYISDLGMPVVELLQPRPGERILDIGCGDGVLTEKIAAVGCEVVGIDASPDMTAAARARGLDARTMNAASLAFDGEFDAVFSNAALHWMHPPRAVVEGAYRALKPGGRFVAEFGGAGNVANIRRVLHASLDKHGLRPEEVDPWYFPTPEEYGAMLNGVGFQVRSMEHFKRPTVLPTGIVDWLESVARPVLAAVPEDTRPAFVMEVEAALRPLLRGEDGVWRADYVRLRVLAVK